MLKGSQSIHSLQGLTWNRFEYFLKLIPLLDARYTGKKTKFVASLKNIAIGNPCNAYPTPSRCVSTSMPCQVNLAVD